MGALERDEWRRAAWKVRIAQSLDARRLVFVDEMGTNISLSPIYYGWSKKGQRAHCAVPRNRGKNTTLLASMSMEGMGPSLAMEGATSARVFETYVERVLAPTLRRGQVVVMDNLPSYRSSENASQANFRLCPTPPVGYRPRSAGRRSAVRVFCEIGGFATTIASRSLTPRLLK